MTGVSRDGQWLVVYARPSEEKAGGTLALPLGGGPPIEIVGRFCGRVVPDGAGVVPVGG